MQSTPTETQVWRLTATLLDTACERRGLRRVSLGDFNRLINALAPNEHPALVSAALDCLSGKPDYTLLSASSIAARLAEDSRLAVLLDFSPSAAALYRLQRDAPDLDLLAILHRASAQANPADIALLRHLLPSPPLAATPLTTPQKHSWSKDRGEPGAAPASPSPHRRELPQKPPVPSAPHELQAQPKMRVFRAKTALTVEWGSLSHKPVLFFQAARRQDSQSEFDWTRRVNIAVTASESFELMQVCLGRSDYAQIQFHGTSRNKSIELKKNMDAKSGFTLLVRVSEGGTSAVLGLSGFDVASLMQLLSISIASKLPIASSATDASHLAQTATLLEFKTYP